MGSTPAAGSSRESKSRHPSRPGDRDADLSVDAGRQARCACHVGPVLAAGGGPPCPPRPGNESVTPWAFKHAWNVWNALEFGPAPFVVVVVVNDVVASSYSHADVSADGRPDSVPLHCSSVSASVLGADARSNSTM